MNKPYYYVGIMSGNSCDAIDSVLVHFQDTAINIQQHLSIAIPNDLKNQIHLLCSKNKFTTDVLYNTEVRLSHLYAESVIQLLKLCPNIKKTQIIAIGNHGQTITHQPSSPLPYSIQIGDPNIIAHKTGITTIMDFRRKDIANSGQGAPLAPVFHANLFPKLKKPAVIINIGGIINLSILKNNEAPSGFDLGPGNLLLDYWCKKHQHSPYDHNGQWAKTGILQYHILQHLLDDPFFSLPPPKSTGKDYFNQQWLEQKLQSFSLSFSPVDIQNTLTHLCAAIILNALTEYAPSLTNNIYLCGGGTYNKYLVELLTKQLPKLKTTNELGITPHLVEAAGFAWLAKQRMEHKKIDLRTITGSKVPALLGGIYEP